MINQKIITEEFKDCYIYGLQLLFSNILIFGAILIISILTDTILIALLFSVSFCLLRAIFDGYHCKQYKHCFIISTGLFCFLLLLKLLPGQVQIILSTILILLGCFILTAHIFLNKKNIKKIIISVIIIFICFALSILFFRINYLYSLALSYAVFATALLIVLEYMQLKADR